MSPRQKAKPGKPARIAVSAGDPAGVGPEITDACLRDPKVMAVCRPLVFWPAGAGQPAVADVVVCGRIGDDPGSTAMACLEAATASVEAGECSALVTAPLSKARASMAFPGFTGHTDWLASRAGMDPARVLMIFHGEKVRTACVTRHVPLREVHAGLDGRRIAWAALVLAIHLGTGSGIRRPRIAIAGLNPHASEGGLLGSEDRDLIEPAVRLAAESAVRLRMRCELVGPLAADGAYREHVNGGWDGVLAMYHDQATVAAKVADPFRSVNVTAGLPYVRTSPDHGTADAIAGKGLAHPGSMRAALLLAARLVPRASMMRKRILLLGDVLG